MSAAGAAWDQLDDVPGEPSLAPGEVLHCGPLLAGAEQVAVKLAQPGVDGSLGPRPAQLRRLERLDRIGHGHLLGVAQEVGELALAALAHRLDQLRTLKVAEE